MSLYFAINNEKGLYQGPLKPYASHSAENTLQAMQSYLNAQLSISEAAAAELKSAVTHIKKGYFKKLGFCGRIKNAFQVYVLRRQTPHSKIDNLAKSIFATIDSKKGQIESPKQQKEFQSQ